MIVPHDGEKQLWERLAGKLPILTPFRLGLERARPPRDAREFFTNWRTWRRVLEGLIGADHELGRTARALGWLTLDAAKPMATKSRTRKRRTAA